MFRTWSRIYGLIVSPDEIMVGLDRIKIVKEWSNFSQISKLDITNLGLHGLTPMDQEIYK